MAVVDPYSPCPCGSGQKFKWCCQKVEAYAEKAQRLYESGQFEAALAAIDDGLRKVPGNSWLTIRKALYLLLKNRVSEAEPILKAMIASHPEHIGARSMQIGRAHV